MSEKIKIGPVDPPGHKKIYSQHEIQRNREDSNNSIEQSLNDALAKTEAITDKEIVLTVEPLADRIIVQKLLAASKIGSIIVPDKVRDNSHKGKVLAVGPGKEGEKTNVGLGDIIMFTKFAGAEIEIDGDIVLMMRQGDVLCVIQRGTKQIHTTGYVNHIKDQAERV